MRYSCASGYKTRGGQDEEVVQCLADGWSSPPACGKEHGRCPKREVRACEAATFSCRRAFLFNRIDVPLCLQMQEVIALFFLNARISLNLRVLKSHDTPRPAVLALCY